MLGLVIVNIGKPEIYTLTFPLRALRVKLQKNCRQERARCRRIVNARDVRAPDRRRMRWERENKQAAPEKQDGHFTSASQDPILERNFHALSGRVTGWGRLTTFTGSNWRVSPFSFQSPSLSVWKDQGVRWGK